MKLFLILFIMNTIIFKSKNKIIAITIFIIVIVVDMIIKLEYSEIKTPKAMLTC